MSDLAIPVAALGNLPGVLRVAINQNAGRP